MFGIDTSHHNANIDWQAVVKDPQGVSFAYLKATEGTGYIDPKFYTNAQNAANSGLKIGFYHFATLNTDNVVNDANAEADYFMKIISTAPKTDLPLVLDIETNKAGLDKDEVLLWINTFFARIEKAGYKDPVLYSYAPFLNANLPPKHGLGTRRLWLAAYVDKQYPLLPNGWKDYWLWQYSAKGKVNGISTTVDLNKSPQSIA